MMRVLAPLIRVVAGLALLAAAPALAAPPRTIDDCEKISAWDAYNKCLAEFGPKRGQSMRSTRAVETQADRGGHVERGRSKRYSSFGRRRNGRAYAVFEITPSRPAARQSR